MNNNEIWMWITIVILLGSNIFNALLGISRGGRLNERQEALCILCPDHEEEKCEEDNWRLDYVLEHCYESPKPLQRSVVPRGIESRRPSFFNTREVPSRKFSLCDPESNIHIIPEDVCKCVMEARE